MADDTALSTLETQAEGTYQETETIDTPETQATQEGGGEGATIDGTQPIEVAGGEGGERTAGTDELPPYEEVKEFTPKQVYETIRHLREEHGDDPTTKRVLHSMTDAYGRLHGFLQEFPEGVTEAREAKAILESFGGFEGIAQLEDLQEVSDMTDDQVRRGDPAFMQRAAQASPEGFAKLVPAGLEILERTNTSAYEEAMRGPVLKALDKAGLSIALESAIKELKAGTPDGIARATDWILRTMGWHQGQQAKFDEAQKYYRDPRVPEFEKREATLSEKTRNMFYDEMSARMDDYMKESFTPQVRQMARGRNISEKGLSDVVNAAIINARDSLAKNNLFSSRIKAFARNAKGPEATNRAMSVARAQIDRIRQNSIKDVWTTRYGSVAPRQQPQPRNGGANNQPIYNTGSQRTSTQGLGSSSENPIPVKQMPPQSEIDITKDPDRTLLFQGRAYHKPSSRWVAWRGLPGK